MDVSIRERVSGFLARAIFCGLLLVIALTAIPFGTVDPWWESVFEAWVFMLVILWIIQASIGGAPWVREYQLLLPLLVLVIFSVIQSLPLGKGADGPAMAGVMVNRALSADPFETWRFAFKMLAVTLTLGLLLSYTSTESRLRTVVYVVVAVALASAVFGLLAPRLPQNLLRLVSTRLSPDKSYGQFENRNHFAFLMEMAIGLVLGLAVNDWHHRKWLALYVLSGLIMWGALLLTHSRGGVFALMFEIPFFFLLYKRLGMERDSRERPAKKRPGSFVLAGLLLGAVAASVILVGGDETIYRIELTPAEFTARQVGPPKIDRPDIWLATLKLIKDHPLAGVGFAAYSVAIPRHISSSGEWTPEQAHNDYLEVLASGGLIGGVLLVWFLVAFVKISRKRLLSHYNRERAIKCGALGGLFAVAVHSIFDFGLHITVNTLVCLALITVVLKNFKTVTA